MFDEFFLGIIYVKKGFILDLKNWRTLEVSETQRRHAILPSFRHTEHQECNERYFLLITLLTISQKSFASEVHEFQFQRSCKPFKYSLTEAVDFVIMAIRDDKDT